MSGLSVCLLINVFAAGYVLGGFVHEVVRPWLRSLRVDAPSKNQDDATTISEDALYGRAHGRHRD